MGSYTLTIAFLLKGWFISSLKMFEGTKGEGKREEGTGGEKGRREQERGRVKVCK